jgi:hypothetical protein
VMVAMPDDTQEGIVLMRLSQFALLFGATE